MEKYTETFVHSVLWFIKILKSPRVCINSSFAHIFLKFKFYLKNIVSWSLEIFLKNPHLYCCWSFAFRCSLKYIPISVGFKKNNRYKSQLVALLSFWNIPFENLCLLVLWNIFLKNSSFQNYSVKQCLQKSFRKIFTPQEKRNHIHLNFKKPF